MRYYFYSRIDANKEPISRCYALTRLKAATYFAQIKNLDLKSFIRLYNVSN
jgi:hypothetical protein